MSLNLLLLKAYIGCNATEVFHTVYFLYRLTNLIVSLLQLVKRLRSYSEAWATKICSL